MVVLTYQYQFVLGPIFLIFLGINLALLVQYVLLKGVVSSILALGGLVEAAAAWTVGFPRAKLLD